MRLSHFRLAFQPAHCYTAASLHLRRSGTHTAKQQQDNTRGMKKRHLLWAALSLSALAAAAFVVIWPAAEQPACTTSGAEPIRVSLSLSQDGTPVHAECVQWQVLPGWQQRLASLIGMAGSGEDGPSTLLRARQHSIDGTGSIDGSSRDSFSLYINESFFPLELSVSGQCGSMRMSATHTLTADSPPFSWAEDTSTGQSVYEIRFCLGDEQPYRIDITRSPATEAEDRERCLQMKPAKPRP